MSVCGLPAIDQRCRLYLSQGLTPAALCLHAGDNIYPGRTGRAADSLELRMIGVTPTDLTSFLKKLKKF